MTRLRRLAVVALIAAAATTVLPACGTRDKGIRELRAAIAKTTRQSQRFVYTVVTPTSATEVKGLVEDDFRFKARVRMNGSDAYDEVVDDDVLAVRFIDPSRIQTFVSKQSVSDAATDVDGVSVLDALRSRRWVVDNSGAPPVNAGAAIARGENASARAADPVVEARAVLAYVGQAGTEAFEVKRFDPEDLSPVYKRSEDTFPRPAQGSGVIRYDFRRPFLPPISAAGAGGPQANGQGNYPAARHFRRMAVYVKDGVIIQVREAIDLQGKSLDDFVNYERAFLKEAKLPDKVLQDYDRFVRETPRAELGTKLLLFLNQGLQQVGIAPIPIRKMVFDLRDIGQPVQVAMPAADVLTGSLEQLTISRLGKAEGTATGATTTTTAPAAPPTSTAP